MRFVVVARSITVRAGAWFHSAGAQPHFRVKPTGSVIVTRPYRTDLYPGGCVTHIVTTYERDIRRTQKLEALLLPEFE